MAALLGTVAAPPAGQAATDDGTLSDEARVTYWAYPESSEAVRVDPSATAAKVATLRMSTELGAPEVYLVLTRKTVAGEPWLQIRVPMRPNGTTGWVPETALTDLHVTYTRLVVDLGKRRATLFESGAPIWRAPIGIGKAGTPTPRGSFYIRQRLQLNGRGGVYGAYAFGTSAYSNTLSDWPGGGVIGIHGTNQPRLIPGRVSHGCIRVRNAQIRDLRSLMGVGTPLLVR